MYYLVFHHTQVKKLACDVVVNVRLIKELLELSTILIPVMKHILKMDLSDHP